MAASSDRRQAPPTDGFSRLIDRLLVSPFPMLLLLLAIAGGAAALVLTPREEEPQIVVPVADVRVQAPGGGVNREVTVAIGGETLNFTIYVHP